MRQIVSGCIFFALMINLAAGFDPPNLVAGKKVEADAKLQKGDKLVGVYEKKNYVVEVLEVKSNKLLKILWVTSKEESDDIAQTDLYYAGDATPTRKVRKSPLPDNYQKYDKNNDGQISMSEWDRAKYAEFRKLDKNHDGFLTPQELAGKASMLASSSGTGNSATTTKETPAVDEKDIKPLPTSGNLVEFEEAADTTLIFKITGRTTGKVIGKGPYDTESDLATAAVHAGALKDGELGLVKVTIKAPVESFSGSEANGVTSIAQDQSAPSFTIEAVKSETVKK